MNGEHQPGSFTTRFWRAVAHDHFWSIAPIGYIVMAALAGAGEFLDCRLSIGDGIREIGFVRAFSWLANYLFLVPLALFFAGKSIRLVDKHEPWREIDRSALNKVGIAIIVITFLSTCHEFLPSVIGMAIGKENLNIRCGDIDWSNVVLCRPLGAIVQPEGSCSSRFWGSALDLAAIPTQTTAVSIVGVHMYIALLLLQLHSKTSERPGDGAENKIPDVAENLAISGMLFLCVLYAVAFYDTWLQSNVGFGTFVRDVFKWTAGNFLSDKAKYSGNAARHGAVLTVVTAFVIPYTVLPKASVASRRHRHYIGVGFLLAVATWIVSLAPISVLASVIFLIRSRTVKATSDLSVPVDVREVFECYYSEASDARRVADEAGLKLARIDFGGPPTRFWYAVILEARKEDRYEDLLAVIRKEFPNAGV